MPRQTVADLRVELDAVSTEALVGGTTATALDTNEATQRDLRVIIPAVLLVTFLVLVLLLRAIVAPLLLIGHRGHLLRRHSRVWPPSCST